MFYFCCQVRYLIMNQHSFQSKHQNYMTHTSVWSGSRSPFTGCPPLQNVSAISASTRCAEFVFDDPNLAAGHFAGLPALPVAVLVGVAYQTLGLHGPDLQAGFTIVEGKMTCSRLVRLGETLQLVSHRQPGTLQKFRIEILDADSIRVATVAIVVQLP